MHDIKDHINHHCPECLSSDGLHWEGRSIACDACGCVLTVEEMLKDREELKLQIAKLWTKVALGARWIGTPYRLPY